MISLVLKQNENYYGFSVLRTEKLTDISATGYLLQHDKSGARLFYLDTEDNNKVFSVSFKTPPQNDCGTAHILEHSVLCGSRKYQAKDPFNELIKCSLNTFLNAMTYADKTMYPIASCNEKDFMNMMDVYLDAVFYPNIYEKKGIFLQEGWRYENDTATGVVFNEMKGALADAESQLASFIAKSIFGDTTYGFESGGIPSAIMDLQYEQFLEFHRTYYHPANAYFYLYGNMDVLKCLEHIDNAYLSGFEKSENLPIIHSSSVPQKMQWLKDTYPIQDGEDIEKGFFAYNFKIGKCTNPKEILMMQLLGYLLLETNASPIKNALRDNHICEDAEGYFDSSTYEMVYSIIAKKADMKKAEQFRLTVENVLQDIAENGIDADLLKSGIKKMEFLLREEDYGSRPKGLVYHTKQMKSWLHDADPFAFFYPLQDLEALKTEIKNGGLQIFIKQKLLENTDKTWVAFAPEVGKQQKEDAILQQKIEQRLDKQQKSVLESDVLALQKFQNAEDTPEILNQIPCLSIADIDKEPQKANFTKKNIHDMKFVHIPMESKGICYFQLSFDTNHLSKEQIPYAGLLADVLGKIDTEYTAFSDISKKIDDTFGGFHFSNDIYTIDKKDFRSLLTINVKILKDDLLQAFSFIKEILLYSQYQKTENLWKIVQAAILKQESYLQNYSHLVAISRSRASISEGAAIKEQTSGIAYYQFLKQIEKQLKENDFGVVENLKKTAEVIFQKQNMTTIIGCEENLFDDVVESVSDFANVLYTVSYKSEKQEFLSVYQKEAFTSNSAVQYNIQTADLADIQQVYSGKLQVLKTILSSEFLWTKVRLQGGAYGCGCNFQKNGSVYFYSYRDPHLSNTFEIYQDLGNCIADFYADEKQMTKYILGTINRFDQPKSNGEWMDYIAAMYFTKTTNETRKIERTEILETTITDIQNYKDFLTHILEKTNICTIGNADSIEKEKDLFQTISNLIQ